MATRLNPILGNDAFYKYQLQTAVENFSNAIRQDSNFTIARIMWSFAYYEQSGGKWRHHEKEKEDCQKLYEKKDQLSPLDRAWTNWLHTRLFDETPNKQIEAIKAILKIDDHCHGQIAAEKFFEKHSCFIPGGILRNVWHRPQFIQ